MGKERKTGEELLKDKPFYPDLPRIDRESILGNQVVLYDWVIRDWNGEFGEGQFAILAIGPIESDKAEQTLKTGGIRVLRNLRTWRKKGLSNFLVTLTREEREEDKVLYDLK